MHEVALAEAWGHGLGGIESELLLVLNLCGSGPVTSAAGICTNRRLGSRSCRPLRGSGSGGGGGAGSRSWRTRHFVCNALERNDVVDGSRAKRAHE